MIFGGDYSGVSVISLMRIGPQEDWTLEINKLGYARANKFYLLPSCCRGEGDPSVLYSHVQHCFIPDALPLGSLDVDH